MVNRSRGIFSVGHAVKENFSNLILQSSGQEHFADVNFAMVKRSRAFLLCGQVVKQHKSRSKFLDPGLSCDYSAYMGVPTPCITN